MMDKKMVLVIHGDDSVQKQLAKHLLGSGMKVIAASSGQEALTKVRKISVSAVFCHFDLADMHSFTLIASLRRMPQFSQTPVIMLTDTPLGPDQPSALNLAQHTTTNINTGSPLHWLTLPVNPSMLRKVLFGKTAD